MFDGVAGVTPGGKPWLFDGVEGVTPGGKFWLFVGAEGDTPGGSGWLLLVAGGVTPGVTFVVAAGFAASSLSISKGEGKEAQSLWAAE